jgi:hypothetical protein
MRTRTAPTMVLALLLASASANAEITIPGNAGNPATEANPSADLAIIRERILKHPELGGFLDRMLAEIGQGGISFAEFLTQNIGRGRTIEGDGIRYRLAAQVQEAERRAERYASIIASDLNGDGSVTRAEIADMLSTGQRRRQGAAEALIVFDLDKNDTLTPEEISAAARVAEEKPNGRDTENLLAEVLDLDDDGNLSPEEVARVEAALRLWAAE